MNLVGALVAWLSLGPGFDLGWGLAPVSVRWKMRRPPRAGAKMPSSTMPSTVINPGRGLPKISQLDLHALSKGKARLPRQEVCPRRFCMRLLASRLRREDFAVSEIGQRSGPWKQQALSISHYPCTRSRPLFVGPHQFRPRAVGWLAWRREDRMEPEPRPPEESQTSGIACSK
jgi:hypothetical protein